MSRRSFFMPAAVAALLLAGAVSAQAQSDTKVALVPGGPQGRQRVQPPRRQIVVEADHPGVHSSVAHRRQVPRERHGEAGVEGRPVCRRGGRVRWSSRAR